MRIPVRVISENGTDREEYSRPYYGREYGGYGGPFRQIYRNEGDVMDRAKHYLETEPEEDREERLEADRETEALTAEEKTESAGGGPEAGDQGASDSDGRDWKDMYIRLQADFENHKRHAESERARLTALGKEFVLDDVFPIVEYMEKAVQAARDSGANDGVVGGVEMVYKQLLGVLEKHGVERVPTVGETFDPRYHEAIAAVPAAGVPEGSILEEVRPGFRKKDRLLRPASVVVAR